MQEVHTSIEQCIIIKFSSLEGVKTAKILHRLIAQFTEETLSRTQVYDWHKNISDDRELVQNACPTADKHQRDEYSCDQWDDRRRPPSYNIGNYYTRRNIIWECPINYFRWFGLPKSVSKVVSSSLGGRSESKSSCRVRKIFGMISNRDEWFLEANCHLWWDVGVSVHPASKQASMEWRKPRETAPQKAKTRLSVR